jgi:hypothetical protein
MQLLNPVIIKEPLNWFILFLMVLLAVFLLELILKASNGEWDCGCNNK